MNDIKEVFSQIQAEQTLKDGTKAFLAQKTHGYTKTKTVKWQPRVFAAACVCLLLVLMGGYWLYFTPTSQISIDINPSLELSVNRFNRVVSANGLNDDGREVANTLDIQFTNYTDAVHRILENETIASLLSNDEVMTITVTGPDETQSAQIFSEMKGCTAEQKNTYCYFARLEEVAAAHEAGLSYGKYRAFLEIQALDPDITPDVIQHMTMREIRDFMDSLSADNENEISSNAQKGHGHRGFGSGHGGKQENAE